LIFVGAAGTGVFLLWALVGTGLTADGVIALGLAETVLCAVGLLAAVLELFAEGTGFTAAGVGLLAGLAEIGEGADFAAVRACD
jgi:hypothetical protein